MHLARFGDAQTRRIRLRTAHRAGVRGIVTSAVSPQDWDAAITLSRPREGAHRAPSVYSALGLHPYAVSEQQEANEQHLEALAQRLAERPAGVVAVGECGLDFRKKPDGAPHFATAERQLEAFEVQLRLAQAHQLPAVIHCVRAHGPLYTALASLELPPSVLHAFGGSAEQGLALTKLGHYLSFAGNVTLHQAKRAREAAAACPLDRLLIETDSPDQTPASRGAQPNEPAFIVDVARTIAEIRGCTLAQVVDASWRNATRVYGVLPQTS